MFKLKNFLVTAANLIGELWVGVFRTKPDFYDKYSRTDTKIGYAIFIASLSFLTIGVLSWLSIASH